MASKEKQSDSALLKRESLPYCGLHIYSKVLVYSNSIVKQTCFISFMIGN